MVLQVPRDQDPPDGALHGRLHLRQHHRHHRPHRRRPFDLKQRRSPLHFLPHAMLPGRQSVHVVDVVQERRGAEQEVGGLCHFL